MTLLILILIAIPICILIILLWIYNDYRKYKKAAKLPTFAFLDFTSHYASPICRQKLLHKLQMA